MLFSSIINYTKKSLRPHGLGDFSVRGVFLQPLFCQKLLPSVNGEMIPAFEIMVLTPAIRNLIREGKVHQINGIIYTSAAENMIAMDSSILQLYKDGRIDKHTAISEAVNPEIMSKRLNLL